MNDRYVLNSSSQWARERLMEGVVSQWEEVVSRIDSPLSLSQEQRTVWEGWEDFNTEITLLGEGFALVNLLDVQTLDRRMGRVSLISRISLSWGGRERKSSVVIASKEEVLEHGLVALQEAVRTLGTHTIAQEMGSYIEGILSWDRILETLTSRSIGPYLNVNFEEEDSLP